MSENGQFPVTSSRPEESLNDVHLFAHRMFPDGPEQWSVAEILSAARRAYDSPDDLSWNAKKIRRAIAVLRRRSREFPSAPTFIEITCSGGYRYPSASCRLILREVINGRLPKKLGQERTKSDLKVGPASLMAGV